jgi:hypothetical protein
MPYAVFTQKVPRPLQEKRRQVYKNPTAPNITIITINQWPKILQRKNQKLSAGTDANVNQRLTW